MSNETKLRKSGDKYILTVDGADIECDTMEEVMDKVGANNIATINKKENKKVATKSTVETKPVDDPVNHPAHYTAGGIECLDSIEAAVCKYEKPMHAFLAGQVIKYIWRAPLKGKYYEDLKKAQFYLNRMIESES